MHPWMLLGGKGEGHSFLENLIPIGVTKDKTILRHPKTNNREPAWWDAQAAAF